MTSAIAAPANTAPNWVQRANLSNPPSQRLWVLLVHAKSNSDFTFHSVAKALGDLYHPSMNLETAMHHLVAAFSELMLDSRYEAGGMDQEPLALLLSPVKGYTAIQAFGPRNLEAAYTVEQFYNAMVQHMFSKLRLSRVDWLFEPATA